VKYYSIKNELINLETVLKISINKDEEHMGDLDLYHITFTFINGAEDKYDILQDKLRELMDVCDTSIKIEEI
jgi:hypothetical protein